MREKCSEKVLFDEDFQIGKKSCRKTLCSRLKSLIIYTDDTMLSHHSVRKSVKLENAAG